MAEISVDLRPDPGTIIDRDMISGWFEEGQRQKARWMLVISDTWSYRYYPEYIKEVAVLKEEIAWWGDIAHKSVKEVYSFAKNFEEQVVQRQAWSVDQTFDDAAGILMRRAWKEAGCPESAHLLDVDLSSILPCTERINNVC